MQPISVITGRIVALPVQDIDTDQIIPARYLKVTDKSGLAEGLFYAWRRVTAWAVAVAASTQADARRKAVQRRFQSLNARQSEELPPAVAGSGRRLKPRLRGRFAPGDRLCGRRGSVHARWTPGEKPSRGDLWSLRK